MALFSSAHGGNIREAAGYLGIPSSALLDVSANINPLGMPESVRQGLIKNPGLAERYPDVEYLSLHQALATHHDIPIDWIQAGNGETESIWLLAQSLRPRRAMLVTPGFAEYRRALEQVDCQIVDFRLNEENDWQLTEAILPALTASLDCLFLCTPNNPTGLLPDDALLLDIAQRCRALHITLILDEAFLDFIPDRTGFIPRLADNPHIWVLRSLTKFYAIAGLRLGYLVNSDPQAMRSLRQKQMPWSINAYAALAGELGLADVCYQQATWRWLATERSWLVQRLQQLHGLTLWPGQANYLFLRCDIAGLCLQQAMLEQHILIRSCANYPGLDARYYRIAIRQREENERVLSGLARVMAGTIPAE